MVVDSFNLGNNGKFHFGVSLYNFEIALSQGGGEWLTPVLSVPQPENQLLLRTVYENDIGVPILELLLANILRIDGFDISERVVGYLQPIVIHNIGIAVNRYFIFVNVGFESLRGGKFDPLQHELPSEPNGLVGIYVCSVDVDRDWKEIRSSIAIVNFHYIYPVLAILMEGVSVEFSFNWLPESLY